MKLQLTTVPWPQTLEKTGTAWALVKQQTMTIVREWQQLIAAALCLQPAAVLKHAVKTLASFLSFLHHHVSPHQCQVFPPSQPVGCLIWVGVCHPTKQKWPSQHLWVLTATWERTPSTKDKPLCAEMMMEGGGSPGCPSRLNKAPALRVSHRGCRRQTSSCIWYEFWHQKWAPLGFVKCYCIAPHSLPDFHKYGSRLHQDNYLPQTRCTNWIHFACACVEEHSFTCFTVSLSSTDSFQSGVLLALIITLTYINLESILGIQFGNGTSLTGDKAYVGGWGSAVWVICISLGYTNCLGLRQQWADLPAAAWCCHILWWCLRINRICFCCLETT